MNKFLVGLILGIAIAGGLAVYLNNAPTPFLNKDLVATSNNNSSGIMILAPGTKIKVEASANNSDAGNKNNASEGNYDFYDVLQSEKAVSHSPQEASIKQSASSPPQPKTIFLVQAGAFSTEDLASNMKAQLALIGITSTIKSQDVGNNTVNKVLIGPFSNEEDAQKTINQLSDEQINAVLIRITK